MDKMVDHLLVFEGQGNLVDILGNYTDYRKQQQTDYRKGKIDQKSKETIATPEVIEPPVKEKRRLSFKEKEEIVRLESTMDQLEKEKSLLTERMSDVSQSGQVLMETGQRLSSVVMELEQATDRWLELSEFT
jgi:ATP-binding cassette subfamily F protein uup